MALPQWRFLLAQQDTTEIGEIFAWRDAKLSVPLNGGRLCQITLDVDNPMVDKIIGTTPTERLNLLLKAYRDGVLMFVGDLTSGEENVEGEVGTFPLVAGDGFWRLSKRLVGNAFAAGYADGTAAAQKDKSTLIKNLLSWVNTVSWSGVADGSYATPTSNGYIDRVWFAFAGQLIQQLSGTLDGPDFEVTPVEPALHGAQVWIGQLNTWAYKGTNSGAVFEYGTGRHNIGAYRRPLDAAGKANLVWMLGPGFPDLSTAGANPIQVASDAASVAAHTMLEDLLQGDIQVSQLRQELVNEHVRIRRFAREQIFFTPVPGADPSYPAYQTGDLVEARAVKNGKTRFDALVRIYNIDFSVSELGVESVELTLVNEASA